MLRQKDVGFEKVFPSGAWRLWALVGNHFAQRTYYGYTKRQALREFVAEVSQSDKR